jgi:EAL domain-containing protein (putative c-di-GMP-specific phosphodiesterase class I)
MNLSGKDLGDEEFLSFVKSRISDTGADPDRLVFEITETAAIHDIGRAISFIKDLKSMGCHFSLDDFGVGFSSFVYLKVMNVDHIKIDGSFIRRLHSDTKDQLFVKAITDVARGEFVESGETLKLLKEYGVDYAQGFHIGKAVPPQKLNAL